MPSLPGYLEYLPACRVILCKTHGHCLRQPQVDQHLRSKYNITVDAYDAAVQAMNDLEIAARMIDVRIPVAGSVPIKGLPILDGSECCATMECPFLSVSAGSLKYHLSVHHKWINGFKKTITYHNKVKLQVFFPSSGLGYFIVSPSASKSSVCQSSRVEIIDLEGEEASDGEVGSSRFKISITD